MRKKMKNNHGMGALPPSGFEWQVGATIGCIKFVKNVTDYLTTHPNLEQDKIDLLNDLVTYVKENKPAITFEITDNNIETLLNSFSCAGVNTSSLFEMFENKSIDEEITREV